VVFILVSLCRLPEGIRLSDESIVGSGGQACEVMCHSREAKYSHVSHGAQPGCAKRHF